MPLSLKFYKDSKKRDKYRNHSRKKNYENGRRYSRNGYNYYTMKECRLILEHKMPDIELAKILKRSVQAIQIMRCRLKRGKGDS